MSAPPLSLSCARALSLPRSLALSLSLSLLRALSLFLALSLSLSLMCARSLSHACSLSLHLSIALRPPPYAPLAPSPSLLEVRTHKHQATPEAWRAENHQNLHSRPNRHLLQGSHHPHRPHTDLATGCLGPARATSSGVACARVMSVAADGFSWWAKARRWR